MVIRLERGQFHDVVLTEDVVYRIPRDADSARRLPARIAMLDALRSVPLPVAVPEPLPGGNGRVAVLRPVPGEPLPDGFREDSAGLVWQLVRLLNALRDAGPLLVGVVPAVDRQLWNGFARDVRAELWPLMSAAGRERAAAELAAVAAVDPTGDALVHGDLGGANVRWSGPPARPNLVGVIDWDSAVLGDQAVDLAGLAVTVGWPAAERVAELRGTATDIPKARAIAGTFALQQALPALRAGDAASLAGGLRPYR